MFRQTMALRFRHLVQMGVLMAAFNAASVGAAAAKDVIKLVAFGDSLTAGYGVAASDAFPVQLQKALTARGHKVEVINSGVSGDTASAGLERFDWAVPDDADAVIVELGANDALRGIDAKSTAATMDALMAKLAARKLPVLVTGMRAPKNWGDVYANEFDAIFPALAAKYNALLYPFFLDGVVMERTLNQADGIHPTTKGVAIIVERILPKVEELLARIDKPGAAAAVR
jgi:acyl-CoA thioesterase I